MILLNKLRTLVYRCSTFASKTNLVVVKPSRFSHQNHLLYRSICSESQPNPTVSYLINSCGLSPEGAISVSKWFTLRSPEKADSVLAFLRNYGFSQTQISKLVRSFPAVIRADTEKTLLPKIEFLASCGISSERISTILVSNPKLLKMSLDKRIIPNYNFLRSCMPSDERVFAALKRGSWILAEDCSKNVVPNIQILREVGMPTSGIPLLLNHFRFIILDHKKFSQVAREVKEMGFDFKKTAALQAMRTLLYKTTMNQCRLAYMRWGWSEDDVRSAFMKDPQCMHVSEKKIMKVMDFVVNKMGLSAGIIARAPDIMRYSFEKRMMPRGLVVQVLLLKGLMYEHDLNFKHVLDSAEERFLEKFVTMFVQEVPQLLNVYRGKVGVHDA